MVWTKKDNTSTKKSMNAKSISKVCKNYPRCKFFGLMRGSSIYWTALIHSSFVLKIVQRMSLNLCFLPSAGEDEADHPMQSVDVLTPAVLWRYAVHPNEWEEAHLGVSRLWQEGTLRTPNNRRVSHGTRPLTHSSLVSPHNKWRLLNSGHLESCNWFNSNRLTGSINGLCSPQAFHGDPE